MSQNDSSFSFMHPSATIWYTVLQGATLHKNAECPTFVPEHTNAACWHEPKQ